MKPFVKLGPHDPQTQRRDPGGLSPGVEQLARDGAEQQREVIVPRAYGFHSARAALAPILLTYGPITLTLPRSNRQVTSPTIIAWRA